MANNPQTEWSAALKAAFEKNLTNEKPSSLRALMVRLEEQTGVRAGSWKKTLADIRKKNRATENTARRIAEALGVARDELPATPEKVTLPEVYADVQELREEVHRLREIVTATSPGVNEAAAAAAGMVEKAEESLREHQEPEQGTGESQG